MKIRIVQPEILELSHEQIAVLKHLARAGWIAKKGTHLSNLKTSLQYLKSLKLIEFHGIFNPGLILTGV